MTRTPTSDPSDSRPLQIGVVGVGRMGSAILTRLGSGTWTLAAHDRDARHAEQVRARGRRWFDALNDLMSWADVVLTVLPDGDAVRGAMSDASLAVCRPGSILIDMASGDPTATRDVTVRADRHGVRTVAAPIGGSPDAAERGAVLLFTAGPGETIDRVRPILDHLTEHGEIRHVGADPADAQTVKLLVNALWCSHALATAEALLVAQQAGIAPARMQALLGGTAAASAFSDAFLPRFLGGDDFATFGIDGLVTELRTVRGLAGGLHTPVMDTTLRQHEGALEQFGPELGELLAVRLLEIQNGARLRQDE